MTSALHCSNKCLGTFHKLRVSVLVNSFMMLDNSPLMNWFVCAYLTIILRLNSWVKCFHMNYFIVLKHSFVAFWTSNSFIVLVNSFLMLDNSPPMNWFICTNLTIILRLYSCVKCSHMSCYINLLKSFVALWTSNSFTVLVYIFIMFIQISLLMFLEMNLHYMLFQIELAGDCMLTNITFVFNTFMCWSSMLCETYFTFIFFMTSTTLIIHFWSLMLSFNMLFQITFREFTLTNWTCIFCTQMNRFFMFFKISWFWSLMIT